MKKFAPYLFVSPLKLEVESNANLLSLFSTASINGYVSNQPYICSACNKLCTC